MRLSAKFLNAKLQRLNRAAGYGENPEYSTIGALYLYHDATGYAVHMWANDMGGVHRLAGGLSARECDVFLSGMLTTLERPSLWKVNADV